MSLRIIGGQFRGRILKTPKSSKTRPTTSMLREAVFNICAEWLPNARFLDLYAGSGAMGFEALSRGAAFATFVERDKVAAQCIRENAALLQVESQVQILAADVRAVLPRLMSPYDLMYIDPPYEKEVSGLFQLLAEHALLAPQGLLFLEERYQSEAGFVHPAFELVESRRYGIAHLHRFRLNCCSSATSVR